MQYWHLEPQKGKKNSKGRNRQPKTSLASNMRALSNWGPWVLFHSSFFNLISPSPFLRCPRRHVFQSTMRSQSISLMFSVHKIMFQMEEEGYWMRSPEIIWLWPELGETETVGERKRGKWEKDLSVLVYKPGSNTELSSCIHLQPKSS